MTIHDWIRNRELRGMVTFSIEEVKSAFGGKSVATIKTELSRLVKKGYICSVYRGFYVVVPVHYQLKGIVPPTYYIEKLMQYVGKPYYLSLLSAAAMHGASHQAVVRTTAAEAGKPRIAPIVSCGKDRGFWRIDKNATANYIHTIWQALSKPYPRGRHSAAIL